MISNVFFFKIPVDIICVLAETELKWILYTVELQWLEHLWILGGCSRSGWLGALGVGCGVCPGVTGGRFIDVFAFSHGMVVC